MIPRPVRGLGCLVVLSALAAAACSGGGVADGGIDANAADAPTQDSIASESDAIARDDSPRPDATAADVVDVGVVDVQSPDAVLPPGVALFDGTTGYVEIPDDPAFSQPATGAITVEAWMRPDSLSMPAREGTGYVHWLGKGESGQQEWVARMYQTGNSEGRDNRISFYAFNLSGGLGTGSYFQDTVVPGEWIYVAGEIDATSTYVFKNGAQRDTDPLTSFNVTPMHGTAPVRIATRDFASFFQGAIARVAVYSSRLSEATLHAHFVARAAGNYDATVLSEPDLVAFYRLDETEGTVAHDALGHRDGVFHGGVQLAAADW